MRLEEESIQAAAAWRSAGGFSLIWDVNPCQIVEEKLHSKNKWWCVSRADEHNTHSAVTLRPQRRSLSLVGSRCRSANHAIKVFLRTFSLNHIALCQNTVGVGSRKDSQVTLEEKEGPNKSGDLRHRKLSHSFEAFGGWIAVIAICIVCICCDLAVGNLQKPHEVASRTTVLFLTLRLRGLESSAISIKGPISVQESNQKLATLPFPISHLMRSGSIGRSCSMLRTVAESRGDSWTCLKPFRWKNMVFQPSRQ